MPRIFSGRQTLHIFEERRMPYVYIQLTSIIISSVSRPVMNSKTLWMTIYSVVLQEQLVMAKKLGLGMFREFPISRFCLAELEIQRRPPSSRLWPNGAPPEPRICLKCFFSNSHIN